MTKDEALKLALEALKWSKPHADAEITYNEAITAIKEALAQPEQEPVAWIDEFGNVFPLGAQRGPKHLNEPMKPLYTAPPQRKPQIWEHEGYDALCQELELWKAEAQRKPLTDEELQPIADEYRILFGSWVKDFAQAIETKLRSKNNG